MEKGTLHKLLFFGSRKRPSLDCPRRIRYTEKRSETPADAAVSSNSITEMRSHMNLENQKKFLIRFGFWAIVLILTFIGLKFALAFLMPFLLAFLIAALLDGPICFLQKKLPVRRLLPAIVLTTLFFLAAGAVCTFLGFRLFLFIKQSFLALPGLYANLLEPTLQSVFSNLEDYLSRLEPSAVSSLEEVTNSLLNSLGSFVSSLSMKAISTISGLAASIPGAFLNLVITIIVTFFLTIDYPVVTGFVLRQLPEKAKHSLGESRNYVFGTLLKCIASYGLILFITFSELAIGLSILRIPNAVLIAVCIAIFDILPVLGTGGIMIPWAIICFLLGNWQLGVGLLLLYLVITVIRNIIEPKIVGHQVGLHPVVTLASMLTGLQLFGVIGLFGFPIALSLLKYLNDREIIHIFK